MNYVYNKFEVSMALWFSDFE